MSIACWMGKFQWLVIHYAKVRVILLGAYLQCHQCARMALRSLRSMAWYHLRWLNPLVWISVTGTYCRNNCSCTAFTSEIQDGQTRCHLYYGNRNDLLDIKEKGGGIIYIRGGHAWYVWTWLLRVYKTHKKNKMWNILHVPSFSITWRW